MWHVQSVKKNQIQNAEKIIGCSQLWWVCRSTSHKSSFNFDLVKINWKKKSFCHLTAASNFGVFEFFASKVPGK